MKKEYGETATGIKALFETGPVFCTDAAWHELEEWDLSFGFDRHVSGLWGDVGPEDWTANDEALECGGRLLSSYVTRSTGTRFWVITEADRSYTTFLLPSDY